MPNPFCIAVWYKDNSHGAVQCDDIGDDDGDDIDDGDDDGDVLCKGVDDII